MSCPDLRQQHSLWPISCLRFHNRSGSRYFFRAALFLGIVIASTADLGGQTWISAVSATTIGNTAKVTWATAAPADSQVEYGTTASYGSVTALAAAKVATHSVD